MSSQITTEQTSEPIPQKVFVRRFSVRQIMVNTAIASLFCAALFQENEWLLATLVTVTVGVVFNELILTIFATGQRRAFAIGHTLAAFILPFTIYLQQFSLPFLLTREALEILQSIRTVNDTNFTVVALVFWIHVSCQAAAYLATYWYLKREH